MRKDVTTAGQMITGKIAKKTVLIRNVLATKNTPKNARKIEKNATSVLIKLKFVNVLLV